MRRSRKCQHCGAAGKVTKSKYGPRDQRPPVCEECEDVRRDTHESLWELIGARAQPDDADPENLRAWRENRDVAYDEEWARTLQERFAELDPPENMTAPAPGRTLSEQIDPGLEAGRAALEKSGETGRCSGCEAYLIGGRCPACSSQMIAAEPSTEKPGANWDPKHLPDELFLRVTYGANVFRGKPIPTGAEQCMRLTVIAMNYFQRRHPGTFKVLHGIARGLKTDRELAAYAQIADRTFQRNGIKDVALSRYRDFVFAHLPDHGKALENRAQAAASALGYIPPSAEELVDPRYNYLDQSHGDTTGLFMYDGGRPAEDYLVAVDYKQHRAKKRVEEKQTREEAKKGPLAPSGQRDQTEARGTAFTEKGSRFSEIRRKRNRQLTARPQLLSASSPTDEVGDEPEDVGEEFYGQDESWDD